MNIQLSKIKKNVSPLRKGIGWLATLMGVAILVLLVACPAASSDDNGDDNTPDPVTVTLTDQTLDTITIAVKTSALETSDTTLWWAVYASDAAVPTADAAKLTAIKMGTFGDPAVAATAASAVTGVTVSSGTTLSGTGNDAVRTLTVDSAALTATKYDVYVVVGNGSATAADNTDRVLSTKNDLAVTDVAPVIGTVTITGQTDTTFTINYAIGEVSTVHYVVQTTATDDPADFDAVEGAVTTTAGVDAAGDEDITTPGDNTIAVTGLTAETTYEVFLVAEDGETTPNKSDVTEAVEGMTTAAPDMTAPTADASPTATLAAGSANGKKVLAITLANLTEGGTLFWMMVPTDATAPTATVVREASADLDYTTGTDAAGSITVVAGADVTATHTGDITIAPTTEVDIYLVLSDGTNHSATAIKIDNVAAAAD